MLTKNPSEAVTDLASLIQYARDLDAVDGGPEFQELAARVIEAAKRGELMDMESLVKLTFLVQEHVDLTTLGVLPVRLMAAYHGVSYAAIRDAIAAEKVRAIKPAHDWLIPAAEVRAYERRFPLHRWLSTVSPP